MNRSLPVKSIIVCLIAFLFSVNFPPTWPVLAASPKAISPVYLPVAVPQERVGMKSALTLPTPYEYTSFQGDKLMLYPYTGRHVALLVNEEYYDTDVLDKIVEAIDDAYEYYAQATGREPALYYQYEGLTTIAAVPRSCGAGCGFLGATGIEILDGHFDVLFRGVADDNQFDQVVFYELGRNFWFYGDKIAYPTEDPTATGFAVFMRFMSMEAAGVAGTPYGGKDFATFRAEVEGLLDLYLEDPAFNWSNTLPLRKSPLPGYGGTDMFASFLFELHARFGDAFVMNIWQEVGKMPTRTTTQDALDNFVIAASRAAGEDLSGLFAYTWRWPVSSQQPITIPALREWTPVAGTYSFSENTRIIIDDPALNRTATVFANDLHDLTNLTIPVVQGATPVAGDILLALGTTDSAIGGEGYLMEVGGTEGIFTIRAKTDAGVFYGTRTILQLLKQGHTVVGGVVRDWPSYPERSLMVDNGRKYFTPDWLKNHIRELAYLKYNYFHLHLSDNEGFHLESDSDRVTPSTPTVSKAELAAIIALASEYHITIIPEIDMPGHMAAILPPDLRLSYDNGEITANGYLNIASDEGYAFAQELIEEYSPLFPGPYWHIGGDEFHVTWARLNHLRDYTRSKLNDSNATAEDGFIYFINQINQRIKAEGKQLRMWSNDHHGQVLQFDQDIILELWDLSVDPNTAISRGHAIMNSTFYPTYYVQGWGKQDPVRAQFPPAALYEQWTPQRFFAEQFPPYSLTANPRWTVSDEQKPKLLGGKFQIWSDNPNAQTEEQVAEGIYEKLRSMAQNNWGSPKQAADYTAFTPLIQAIGRAPGYSQAINNDKPHDFAGEISNPNAIIPSAHYGHLTGDGAFGSQTGDCAINVHTNGFLFTLDSDGKPLNYSGVIEGGGNVALIAASAGSSVAEDPIILSGDQPNRYSGVTTLKRGIVQLAKPVGVTAIPGDLVMENQGDNDELYWAAADQIADSANLTILSTSGKLSLQGFQETINSLNMVDGARIETSPDNNGVLTVNQFWYNNIAYEAGTYTADNVPFLTGGGRLVVLQSPYDFAGEITNPNAIIPSGSYGNLTGHGAFGWQTGNSAINVNTNGFLFSLDSHGNPLNYSGVIEGGGGVALIAGSAGSHTARDPITLSGNLSNRYRGQTTLKRGVVQLAKPAGVTAIQGDLVMENQGDNDELRWLAADQIADSASLTILSTAGKLTLNGFQETINSLNMVDGARIETSPDNDGVLTVNQFWYNNTAYDAGTYTADNTTFLTGGGRLLVLQSPHDFAGEISNPNATIASGSYGNLTGDGAFAWNTGNCSINVGTNGFLFTLDNGNGNPLNYSGVIEGSGSVALLAASASASSDKVGVPIILSGNQPNRYRGQTTLKQGVVELAKSAGVSAIPGDLVMENQGDNDELRWAAADQIADSANLTILSTSGKLSLQGFQETINNLQMADGARIETGSDNGGVLTVNQFWYGNIEYEAGTYTADNAAFLSGGGRLLVLQSPYDFAGEITNPNATIPSGSYGNLTGNGAFGWQTGNSAINVHTNGFLFALDSHGNPLNYSGVIEGGGKVALIAGSAGEPTAGDPIILSGNLPNRYRGLTTLKQGVVELAKSAGVSAIPGDLVMENQGDNDELRWAAADQIADSANLTILSTAGELTLNGFKETINSLNMVDGARIETSPDNNGVLTVNQFWYNNIAYEAGTYTADNAPFLTGGGRLQVLQSVTPHDFAGEITNPNAIIASGSYGNLTGNGAFGWQTGNCAINVHTNGFLFTLDSDGNALNYSGVIEGSGDVALLAASAGSSVAEDPIILSGNLPNRYRGLTTLKQGVVQLAKSAGVTAIPGDLVMENQGDNDELRWAAADQIADDANLTILSTAGELTLNGFQETINSLRMADGARIETGPDNDGVLTVNQFWYNDMAYEAGTYTADNTTFLTGGGRLQVLQNVTAQSVRFRSPKMAQSCNYNGTPMPLISAMWSTAARCFSLLPPPQAIMTHQIPEKVTFSVRWSKPIKYTPK